MIRWFGIRTYQVNLVYWKQINSPDFRPWNDHLHQGVLGNNCMTLTVVERIKRIDTQYKLAGTLRHNTTPGIAYPTPNVLHSQMLFT